MNCKESGGFHQNEVTEEPKAIELV